MNAPSNIEEHALNYFRKKGYRVERDIVLEGSSGISHRFDLIVTRSSNRRGVRILNWKRTVGVNVVIKLDKASEDVNFRRPILISNKFSSHAKAYANRKSILLLTRQDIRRF
jgi:hypothetical protein